ncbi:MAG TPA: hypothetical protein VNU26_02165 [Mycobacteriales bacterium]|nr:hypothetical protein [Mycobacteriales bacterium]
MPRRTIVSTALVGLASATVAGLATSTAGADPGAHDRRDSRGTAAEVRQAIAPYRDVAVALAAGYRAGERCAQSPAGGMGFHYVNPALIDGVVDPTRPEILLFGPGRDGDLTLLGAEFFVPAALATDRPTLAGEPLEGPMPGHEPGMPEHYDLHVWVYRSNPDGVFSTWNRAVSCP